MTKTIVNGLYSLMKIWLCKATPSLKYYYNFLSIIIALRRKENLCQHISRLKSEFE